MLEAFHLHLAVRDLWRKAAEKTDDEAELRLVVGPHAWSRIESHKSSFGCLHFGANATVTSTKQIS